MTRTSADVEREVEATRGQIDQTVQALKEKMQPRELFNEASRFMGAASDRTLTMMMQRAKQNPIPLALMGLGLAWMVVGGRRRRAFEPRVGDYDSYEAYDAYEGLQESGGRQRLKRRLDTAVDSARDAFEGAKDKLSEVVDHAKEGLADARTHAAEGAESAKGRVSALAHSAQDRAVRLSRQAQTRYHDVLDAEPLVIGAIGLAVGAAMGAALPSSSVERRYMGPTRDKVVERGKEMAQQSLGDVKHAAQRAYGQVKEELHLQGGHEASPSNGAY